MAEDCLPAAGHALTSADRRWQGRGQVRSGVAQGAPAVRLNHLAR